MELKPWKILKSESAFRNPYWDIVQETVELPDGTSYSEYYVNHSKGAVAVLGLTENGTVLVNRQYKHGVREIVRELTVGRIDEGDADPLVAAKRELFEETGYGEGEWEALGTLISNPSSSTARLYVYLARGVRKLKEPQDDAREKIELSEVAPAELLKMCFDGRLTSHATLAIVFLAAKRLGWIAETV